MVDPLFIAHEQACETELAHLLSADLDAGRVPDPKALASRLTPRHMSLPRPCGQKRFPKRHRHDSRLETGSQP
jgi:plasmid stability protein